MTWGYVHSDYREMQRIQSEIDAAHQRLDLETKVMQRHGYIAKIENMSDDALRILLEERPRR